MHNHINKVAYNSNKSIKMFKIVNIYYNALLQPKQPELGEALSGSDLHSIVDRFPLPTHERLFVADHLIMWAEVVQHAPLNISSNSQWD